MFVQNQLEIDIRTIADSQQACWSSLRWRRRHGSFASPWICSCLSQTRSLLSKTGMSTSNLISCYSLTKYLEYRIKSYHYFSWTFSFIMASVLGSSDTMHGYYYASEGLDKTGICWVRADKNIKGWNILPSVFLYIPLFIVFTVSVWVLCVSYYWLRQGVSKTFQHRVKAFLANLTNLLVYTVYWAVNITLFGIVFLNLQESDYPSSRPAWKLIFFFISSKGFANLIILILVSENPFLTGASRAVGSRKSSASEISTLADGFDFNVVLREEVLHYVTTGIRSTTERSTLCKETVKKIVFRMTKRATDRTQRFNTSYLLRLLFNPNALQGTENVVGIENKIRQSQARRSQGVEATYLKDSYIQNPVHDRDRKISSNSSGSQRSVERTSSTGNPVRGSGLSFTGITDGRASFTEYDVSVVDGELEENELKHTSGSGRFQSAVGLIGNLLRATKPVNDSCNNDLAALEEGGEEGEASAHPEDKAGLTVEEVSGGEDSHSSYTFVKFFHRCFTRSVAGEDSRSRKGSETPKLSAEKPAVSNLDEAAVNFTGYDPYQFYRIRRASGVSEREFMDAFSETVKERLQDGGASGAFFFFSKGERFMAKSCSEAELLNIRRNVHTYADYFEKNPMSCIARVYGAFQLRIYSTSFFFYVMHNIFLTLDEEVVNEKYDIKGSWVNRNAAVPREGQVVTCSNCNQKFTYDPSQKAIKRANKEAMKKSKVVSRSTIPQSPQSSQDEASRNTTYSMNLMKLFRRSSLDTAEEDGRSKRCLLTVTGKHEPNVVLKDNDLKHKLKIPKISAQQLLEQLKKDAELLCNEVAVMDYSLLVGVHNTVYEVDEAREETTASDKSFNSSGAWGGSEMAISAESPLGGSIDKKKSPTNPVSRFPVSGKHFLA